MGFDQPKQSSSSGVVIAIVAAVLLVAILGIVAVALVFTTRLQMSKVDAAYVSIKELNSEMDESSVAATLEASLNFEVSIDRDGNVSVDGKEIGLDELKTRLAKLKAETSNTFSVQINADPECPVKHVIPVLDVCKEVGDVDISIVSSSGADSSPDKGDAGDGSGK